jgi:hypothetical protein
MLESLYRAGFNIADEQLDDNARRKSCGASTRGGSAPDGWLRGRFRRKVKLTLPGRFRLKNFLEWLLSHVFLEWLLSHFAESLPTKFTTNLSQKMGARCRMGLRAAGGSIC